MLYKDTDMLDLSLKAAHAELSAKFITGISKLVSVTPVGIWMLKLIKTSKNEGEVSELISMLAEVNAHERRTCDYCKAVGHNRSKCPLVGRLR